MRRISLREDLKAVRASSNRRQRSLRQSARSADFPAILGLAPGQRYFALRLVAGTGDRIICHAAGQTMSLDRLPGGDTPRDSRNRIAPAFARPDAKLRLIKQLGRCVPQRFQIVSFEWSALAASEWIDALSSSSDWNCGRTNRKQQ